jgi:hypothetical protein
MSRASEKLKTAESFAGKVDGPLWRHPTDRRIVLPYRFAAAVALMQSGMEDFSVIAAAVGLKVVQVRQIDTAQTPAVRLLALKGIPAGQFFRLQTHVRCPSCRSLIFTAPCVACSSAQAEALLEQNAAD